MVKQRDQSIRQRLLNLAKGRGEAFDFILNQYVLQRILYRLSVSEYAQQFMLKGALLFWVWQQDFHRPTRDIDLLGFMDNDIDTVQRVFEDVLFTRVDDGLQFDGQAMRVSEIKKDAVYKGVRIVGVATLARARIPFQIDVGFGDAVERQGEPSVIPGFLDEFPATYLRLYPVNSVIAEKFHAMVVLDYFNSRYKDFYDVHQIANTMVLDFRSLREAIVATFSRRQTAIGEKSLLMFGDGYKQDTLKTQQWQSFINKNQLGLSLSFAEVVEKLEIFLMPLVSHLHASSPPAMQWKVSEWQWQEATAHV